MLDVRETTEKDQVSVSISLPRSHSLPLSHTLSLTHTRTHVCITKFCEVHMLDVRETIRCVCVERECV
jgi:hypothetical protein